MSFRTWIPSLTLAATLLLSGVDILPPADPPETLLQQTAAADQIHNEAGGTTTVSYSLVEGGLSAGTTGADAVVHSEPAFMDALGPDGREGSRDDDYRPTGASPVNDAGSSDALIRDWLDLDDDGDTDEPIPVDRSGAARVTGAAVDLGAYEFDDGSVAAEPVPEVVDRFTTLDVYPVPATNELRIRVGASSTRSGEITLHDMLGRKLRTLHAGALGPEGADLRMKTDGLASGVYLVVLRTEMGRETRSVVIVDE